MIKNGRVLSNRGSEEFFFIDWIPQVQNSTCENPSHNVYKNESGKEESENRKKWADLKMKEKKTLFTWPHKVLNYCTLFSSAAYKILFMH